MLFQGAITIPCNTTSADPTIVILKIANGIITKFMVRPRAGHAGLAHLIILYHETQIAPSTENMDFHGDKDPLDWEDFYESYQPPYELKLIGWNEDDTYSHTFDVYVAILPRKAILSLAVTDAIRKAFLSLVGLFNPRRIQ